MLGEYVKSHMLKAVHYFRKNLHLWCLTEFWIHPFDGANKEMDTSIHWKNEIEDMNFISKVKQFQVLQF